MPECMKLREASFDDATAFALYIKSISRLENYLEEIGDFAPLEIYDALELAKVKLENDFIAFVKALQPLLPTKEVQA